MTQGLGSGYYIPAQGTALNSWKKAFVGGGTKITPGTYPAGATGEVMQLSFAARKLLKRSESRKRCDPV